MAGKISFDILGASFSISADENEEYLKKVLEQFNEAVKNTQNISGINEPINVAILTGFLLCDEINKIKQRYDEINRIKRQSETEFSEAEQRTFKLIESLESALSNCAYPGNEALLQKANTGTSINEEDS